MFTDVSPTISLKVATILSFGLSVALPVASDAKAQSCFAPSSTKALLHDFLAGRTGARPIGRLVYRAGDLYGVTQYGGIGTTGGFGTVFRLRPPIPPSTAWTKVDLYRFMSAGGADAARPSGGPVFDTSGALYGVTREGGDRGLGAVYRLTPPVAPSTVWTKTVLYSFQGQSDGASPIGELVLDSRGALYGVTRDGGISGAGTVFRLSPPTPPAITWTKTTIYSFRAVNDGVSPLGGVIFGHDGALYGATYSHRGASYGTGGTVYRLAPPVPPGTAWTKSELHRFGAGADGAGPRGALAFDGSGALYGVTAFGGGGANGGVVFRLTPPIAPATGWTETVLHRFSSATLDRSPSGVLLDTAGAIYGVTETGGLTRPFGAVYRLAPPALAGGAWTRTALHSFNGGADGELATDSLTFDATGALLGATSRGGTANGTIYRLGR